MPKGNNVITWLKAILKQTKKALALSDQNNKIDTKKSIEADDSDTITPKNNLKQPLKMPGNIDG